MTDVGDTLSEVIIAQDLVTKVMTWTGCRVGRCTISGSQGQPIRWTLDIEGETESIGNAGTYPAITLSNDNFKPHPALSALLEWFATRGATSEIRNASSRAQTILRSWRAKHESPKQQQMALFFEDQGAA